LILTRWLPISGLFFYKIFLRKRLKSILLQRFKKTTQLNSIKKMGFNEVYEKELAFRPIAEEHRWNLLR
jgi:hypothetical protein